MTWPHVYAPGIPFDREYDVVHYLVLFVPEAEGNIIWEQIKNLTAANQLGCRSAISPDLMDGPYEGCRAIVLDTPFHLIQDVEQSVRANWGDEYIYEWKQRVNLDYVGPRPVQ